jgi:hypothetical protein
MSVLVILLTALYALVAYGMYEVTSRGMASKDSPTVVDENPNLTAFVLFIMCLVWPITLITVLGWAAIRSSK